MDIHPIGLDTTEWEGDNNAYVLDGADVTLVDTGVMTESVERQLRDGLAEVGHSFADIDRVFLTHWHTDHSGLAGKIQAESGSPVYVHEDDAPLVERDSDAVAAMRDRQLTRFDEWGMPAAKRDALLALFEDADGIPDETPETTTFRDGDRFELGDTSLEVVHTPGHTAGLCCLEFVGLDGREAFCGDALLPVYTPNIGGADVRVDRPLDRYVESLRRIRERDYDRLWPGHRRPITDPSARADTIHRHHEERSWRVLNVLDEHGPANAWTVSSHLFGSLEGIHVLHGPGEAYAHLDHLQRVGAVAAAADGYRITPEGRERLATLDEKRWPIEIK